MSNFPNIRNHYATYMASSADRECVSAKGASVTDDSGNTYLSLNDISCVLGYQHPRFTREVSQLMQTKLLGHFGQCSGEKEKLIANFMEVTHGDFDKLLVTSCGGEAVDWAIKTARRATGRDGIISFRNALHGRSFAGTWLSDIPTRKDGFGTGLENVSFWDYPDDGRPSEPTAGQYEDIAAVLIEPYQALGMSCPSSEYWQWLRRFTKERGILLIFDEIQTGFGKTGTFFAYEQLGIVPDILLAGKGMSNGFGLGALLLSQEAARKLNPWELAGGSADNELMCSIVNLVFDIFREEGILEHVQQMHMHLTRELVAIRNALNLPGRICGKGLFLSMELPEGMAEQVVAEAKNQGILLGRSRTRILFRPPLVLTASEIARTTTTLRGILRKLCTEKVTIQSP